LKDEFILKGVDEKRIYPYGIPVSRQFLESTDRKTIFSGLGFDEKPTVLLMGGGLGLGSIKVIFKVLMQSRLDIQIIAVTGNNTKLKRQIEYLSREGCHKVKVCGFTDKIPDFMAVSDILITKPGGLTISEALIKELPMIIISPIPGQEERNANYLLNKGVAVSLDKTDDTVNTISELLDNNDLREQMKINSRKIAKPDAVVDIANLVMSLHMKNIRSQAVHTS
jgi:processive 1,2-diacylglycerol beta-glucosyltransferase